MTILIKNGRILNPATEMDQVSDLYIEDGVVSKIGKKLSQKADRVIDAKKCFVMPGFIDLHVHFRDPGFEYKEDVFTGMESAAHGGYTTVLCMPNTKPVADNPDVIEYVHNKAKNGNGIHVYQVGAVTKGQQGKELSDIEGMHAVGCPAISEDGKSVMDSYIYKEAMKKAAELNMPVLAHCEDINLVHGGVMNLDKKSEEYGMPGISNSVEDVIVARDIMLARDTGAQLHLCHCSTKDSVTFVAQAKKAGLSVSAEVCPHHFTLSSYDIKDFVPPKVDGIIVPQDIDVDTNYKMNPPLRTQEDVDALKEGLKSGIMEVISTDHAPHAEEEKAQELSKAPNGIIGFETALPAEIMNLVDTGELSYLDLVKLTSYNPANLIKIDRGTIEVGKVADITIFDPNEEYVYTKEMIVSKSKNSPFIGKKLKGKVKYTIVGGKIVYENSNR